jgi:cytochrome c-type biogenesis protein CcmH
VNRVTEVNGVAPLSRAPAASGRQLPSPSGRLARRAPALPLWSLLALLLFAPFPIGVAQDDGADRLEARTFEVADQLRCPVCVSESVAQSSSPISIQMRQIIQEQLEQGRSEAEILAFFQERYGDWILLEPPKRGLHLLVWLLPAVAGLAGIVALALFMRRWLRASREPIEVDEGDLRRVRDALAERK